MKMNGDYNRNIIRELEEEGFKSGAILKDKDKKGINILEKDEPFKKPAQNAKFEDLSDNNNIPRLRRMRRIGKKSPIIKTEKPDEYY